MYILSTLDSRSCDKFTRVGLTKLKHIHILHIYPSYKVKFYLRHRNQNVYITLEFHVIKGKPQKKKKLNFARADFIKCQVVRKKDLRFGVGKLS